MTAQGATEAVAQEKTCTKCSIVKQVDEFGFTSGNRGALKSRRHSWCRACRRAQGRAYRKARRVPTGRPVGRPRKLSEERAADISRRLVEAYLIRSGVISKPIPVMRNVTLDEALLASRQVEEQNRSAPAEGARTIRVVIDQARIPDIFAWAILHEGFTAVGDGQLVAPQRRGL